MVTYYAMNAGGNWNTAGTWSSVAAKDATRVSNGLAPTNAIDCVLDDYSGSVTVNSGSVGKTMNCTVNGNYAGTLAVGTQTLTISGSITLSSGMNLTATTGVITLNAAATITTNTKTIPTLLLNSSGATFTLGDALTATTFRIASSLTFAGNFSITSTNLYVATGGTSAITVNMLAGTTWTVSSVIYMFVGAATGYNTITFKTTSAGTHAHLNYAGTVANQTLVRVAFTDIDASGGNKLYDYQGTVSSCTNIDVITLPPSGGGFLVL